MKITSVRATQPATPGSPPDWRTQLGQIVVQVTTNTGLVGIGVGGGGRASIHLIETVLHDRLVGCEAEDVEQLHAEMFRHTAFYGRSGLVVMAISGVDLALWDVRGKRLGRSIAQLLGAEEPHAALPTYATVWGEDEASAAIERGHSAIKLHVERFGDQPDETEIAALVSRTRDVLGPDAPIMIDAFARWDIDSSLRVAEAVQPFGVDWLEEPLPPDDYRGYEQLSRRSPVPIAGGEHEYGVAGFRRLIENELHSVLQPDVNWCGGLTTLLDVYREAQAAGLRVCPHRGCEPYALPAIAAVDQAPLAESPRSWFNCLDGAPQIERGRITASTAPGFGVSLLPMDESEWPS